MLKRILMSGLVEVAYLLFVFEFKLLFFFRGELRQDLEINIYINVIVIVHIK